MAPRICPRQPPKTYGKLHGGKNVNGDEFQLMVAYKDVKSTPANWKKIKDFASGKFDVEEMVIFLVAMAPIFKDKPPFTPDLAVRQYAGIYHDTCR